MNDFAFNAINSNSEERTSSMSDYSTSTTPDETRYQENTPTITPEIVDDEVVDAENLDDIDDGDLVETNPVAALAETFQGTVSKDAPKPYTREEALKATEELKIKLLHALEAQYDLVSAAQEAFDRHIWTALGYPEGAKGWIQYCKDNFTSAQIRVTGQQRTDLIMGFDVAKISNRGIAALLGVDEKLSVMQKLNPVSLPRKAECVTRRANASTLTLAACRVRNAARRSWNSPRKAPSRPTSPTCSTYPNLPCPTRSARTGCVA